MIKQHGQLTQIALGAADLTVIAAAWILAYFLRFTFFPWDEVASTRDVVLNLFLTLLVSLVVLTGMGLYRPRRDKSFLQELGQILKATGLVWGILIVTLYYIRPTPFTRGMLAIFLPTLMAGMIIERGMFRAFTRYIRRRGWNLRHALIVGTGRLAQSTMHRIHQNSWTGIRVAGFVDVNADPRRSEIRGIPVIGTVSELKAIIEQRRPDCVFVALPSTQGDALHHAIAQLEQTAVDVRIIPDLFLARFPGNISVSDLDGLPVLSLRETPLAGWPGLYKRAFDLFGALFGLALFGLPMLAIAAAIRFSGPGPVIYRQRRMSVGGKEFDMFKFRTMVTNAEAEGAAFALPNDPRCTRLGKWLRSTSLDELPQLLNVLRGDMSLVGPRPERPEMLERIQKELPAFPQRMRVRAGLTGWAQVNGYRGRTSFRKRLQYDLYYLNNWSPMLDLRIVLFTLFRGFRHPNAY